MRKTALIALVLLLLAPGMAFAEKRIWNIETLRDKRRFREWVDLCLGVIRKDEESVDSFCRKIAAKRDEHADFLNQPAEPGFVGPFRHVILDLELDAFKALAAGILSEDNKEKSRQRQDLRFQLVNHVVEILSQNEYAIPIDQVLALLDDPEGEKGGDTELRIVALTMLYNIYSAPLDLADTTFAHIGDLRAYDKITELGLLQSKDRAVRYWAVRIVGLYTTEDAVRHIAAAIRDPSPIIRIAAIRSLANISRAAALRSLAGQAEELKAQAGRLLLARLRELLDDIAKNKTNAALNQEASVVIETLIDLFRKDIAPLTDSDGRNGFGAITATSVEVFLTQAEEWFKWWKGSPYSSVKTNVELPGAETNVATGAD